ncbi:putative WSC domain-containing protein 2 [Hypsibius exemplaris]|uniref:WSC domain-containing protein 2 n=1 Tax=Hypsibius exemplaris TaxID=2072580 RepID=A0A1W0WTY5_HYPEX|nr:putative WSC domain-containing protein 2 [Hypsibius exemplaris]
MIVKGLGCVRISKKIVLLLLASLYVLASFYSRVEQLFPADANGEPRDGSSHGVVKLTRPWLVYANRSDCRKASRRRITETDGLLPTTSLLSVHGSGNTWLRWLIERLTGICTGSVYQERQLIDQGFKCEIGPVYNGLTIVQKSHYFYHHNATKTVLLIRYPLDTIVSDFHRTKTRGNHTGLANVTDFDGLEWDNFVIIRAVEWLNQILTALSHATDLHVVFYENLLTHLRRELKQIADFLQVFVTDERVNCVLKNQEGKFKRKSSSRPLPETYFSSVQLEVVNLLVARAAAEFSRRNILNIPARYRHTAAETAKLHLEVPTPAIQPHPK